MSSRFRFFFSATLLAISVAVIGSSFRTSSVAKAAPGDAKVTICHRTHAVTNPYRRITVARSAADTGSNGHQNAKHDYYDTSFYTVAKPVPNVFNKSRKDAYTPTMKLWGDIIPNVDVDGVAFPYELNFTNGAGDLRGQDIWNNVAPYDQLCKARTTAEFVKGEKDAGIDPADIRQDLKEQQADDDADALAKCGGNFTNCDLSIINSLDVTTTTVAPTTVAPTTVAPTTVAPTTVAPGATTTLAPGAPGATTTVAPGTVGSLKGIIWIDLNRNGLREENEPFLQDTKVVASKSGSTSASALSNSVGFYEIKNVAPGTWTLTAELTAAELERVYDSTGAADWSATAIVPAGGVGQADFAAAGKSTISLALLKTSAKSVVAKWAGSDNKFCSADDIAFTGTAKNGELKLTGIPAGSYRVASDDPCDDGVAYVRAAVKKASVVKVNFAPELPATGSNHGMSLTFMGLLLLAVGGLMLAPRRRTHG